MSELMRLPKPEPVYVTIPPVLCETPECDGLRQYDMVALFLSESRLEIIQVCGRCMFLWKGVTPTNFFPLNQSPSIQWMAHQVEQEIERRQRAAAPPVYNVFYGNTGTSTGGYNTYFRFR